MNRSTAIEAIRSHADELRKRGVTSMYLFGSTASDQAAPQSDVDLFFDYRQDGRFSLFDLMDVRDYVEQILGARADVIPRNSLHRRIKDEVVEEAFQIF